LRKIRVLLLVPTICLLSGCALQMQVMPRDSGTIYKGSVQGNGFGSGTMSVTLGDRTCSGSFSRGASNDSFGFFQSYGNKGTASVGSVQTYGGTATVKALMSCSDGTGLRCDFVGGGGTGTGICVDSKGQVFDVLVM